MHSNTNEKENFIFAINFFKYLEDSITKNI